MLAEDEEAIRQFRMYIQPILTQSSFCQLMGINKGNFCSYLQGKKGSPASRRAIEQYMKTLHVASGASSPSNILDPSLASTNAVPQKESESAQPTTTPSQAVRSVVFSTSPQPSKKVPIPCKHSLRGRCGLPNCDHYHPTSHLLEKEDYLSSAAETHSKLYRRILSKASTLRLLFFIDGDQEFSSCFKLLDAMIEEKDLFHDLFHGVICFSPKNMHHFSKYMESSQYLSLFSFVPSIVDSKDAVDTKLSMEAMGLHYELQMNPKVGAIEFGFFSLNWFCVELVENFKAMQRPAFCTEVLSSKFLKEKLLPQTDASPSQRFKDEQTTNTNLAVLLDRILKSLEEHHGELSINKVAEVVSLKELQEVYPYRNWQTVLNMPFASNYLKADVFNTPSGPILRQRTAETISQDKIEEEYTSMRGWVDKLTNSLKHNPLDYRKLLIPKLLGFFQTLDGSFIEGFPVETVQEFLQSEQVEQFANNFVTVFGIDKQSCIDSVRCIVCQTTGPIGLRQFFDEQDSKNWINQWKNYNETTKKELQMRIIHQIQREL